MNDVIKGIAVVACIFAAITHPESIHQFYTTLTQPQSVASACNAQIKGEC